MKKCIRCNGTGEYRGNGFMFTDCNCNSVINESPEVEPEIDRNSKYYKDAINKLMKLHKGMSRAEAIELFEETYADS